jgi:hypothetical protein
MRANKSLHRFDNGLIPTADGARDNIKLTRNSPLSPAYADDNWANTLISRTSARQMNGESCQSTSLTKMAQIVTLNLVEGH